jgi:hypothetical protein
MSDHQGGPGWWLASDGRWYPPDQAPPVPPVETWTSPPAGPPPRGGLSSGAITALVIGCVVGVVLLVVVAAAFLGTDSDSDSGSTAPADVAPADAPEGYELAEGDGASIAVPAGWTVLDAEDVSMTPEELEEAFPDAPPEVVEQEAAMFEKGAVLVAFDFTDDAFSSNVNILRFPGEEDLDVLGEQAEREIGSLGGEIVSNTLVELPVGPATRVQYEADVSLPDGSTLPVRGVQHYVPVGGYTYVVTITSDDDLDTLSDQMMATFRVG